jgi:hypothetical protein
LGDLREEVTTLSLAATTLLLAVSITDNEKGERR